MIFFWIENQQIDDSQQLLFFRSAKMSAKTQELIVCKNFKLVKKLGTGAFGEIYLAENRSNTTELYAAKLEEAATKFPQLYYQAKIYKYLNSFGPAPGIPKIHAVTTEGLYNVMLMDLLGSSLQDLFMQAGKRLSLKTVLQVGEQMLERIEILHEKNILHRDIKPDNFLMGVGKNAHLVYIVDFGLSKRFIQENKHIPYKQGKELTGTARYASINTHMGIQQSRRDDIESIGYVMMYLLRGVLPWQNMKAKDTKAKYKMIMEKKISTPAEFLCKGFPNELASFINCAKGLKFQEKPDYKYLKELLGNARKANKIEVDYVYDWSVKSSSTVATQESSKAEQKLQRPKAKEEKVELKVRKQESLIVNNNGNNTNTASLIRSTQQTQNNIKKEGFREIAKSLNKNGQTSSVKNPPNNLLNSLGVQNLLGNKVNNPKISVIRK